MEARGSGVAVAAVVLTYNRLHMLERCLEAVRAQSSPPTIIVVVNNASTDGTKRYLDGLNWPELICIHLEVNVGGAGGFHAGMAAAAKLPVASIWMMDDDCFPERDALLHLLEAKRDLASRKVPHTFLCSRPVDTLGCTTNVPVPSRRRGRSGEYVWADLIDAGYALVDEASFVSFLVDCDVVATFGLPLRQMVIWGDDSEYTRRLTKHAPGVLVGKSLVKHERAIHGSPSILTETDASRIDRYRFAHRNHLYVYRKHHTRPQLAAFIARHLQVLAKLLARGEFKRSKYIVLGLAEGFVFNPTIEFVEGRNGAERSKVRSEASASDMGYFSHLPDSTVGTRQQSVGLPE